MNRIILIGNGFDLAHGLKTSYKHFIDWFWEEEIEKIKWIRGIYDTYNYIEGDYFHIESMPKEGVRFLKEKQNKNFKKFKNICDSSGVRYYFKNLFLEYISDKSFQWVDVETEYYNKLVKYAQADNYSKLVKTLNSDFEKIKNKLEEYLTTQTFKYNPELISAYEKIMFGYIDPKDFTNKKIIESIREKMYSNNEIKNPQSTDKFEFNEKFDDYVMLGKKNQDGLFNTFKNNIFPTPNVTICINFNYTDVLTNYYFSGRKKEVVNIHGELNNNNNSIIFGYGDEIDDNYKMLENKNENYILENMKSMHYSKTNNYNKVLNFINADKYQIIILGHSCGNSDRTLLNKLFEHENCVSIKPYYYVNENEKSDYFDKYINISRNFNNKNLLREKVVNEKYCAPMPQITDQNF